MPLVKFKGVIIAIVRGSLQVSVYKTRHLLAIFIRIFLYQTFAKRRDLETLAKDVEIIKNEIENLPDQRMVHELELQIETLRGDIKRIEPLLNSLKNLSDMLLENELKQRNSK